MKANLRSRRITSLLGICMIILLEVTALAETSKPVIYPDDPVFLKNQFIQRTFRPENIIKKPRHYTITDWQNAIDSTWGWGLLKAQKLQIFDTFWDTTDAQFACFVDLPGYTPNMWDSLKTLYRTEIETGDPTYGVSRGRFGAIMNYLSKALMESHTNAIDLLVSIYTYPDPGIPLLVVGAWGSEPHFRAGLTPLDDNTLLVYKTEPNHPLGLEPGDKVLGYDGIPWSDLYHNFLNAQLPINWSWWWGSSEYTFDYSLMISAGMNWHLCDTIDILKYNTGDTLHLSTAAMEGGGPYFQETEQMDIPGVPMPDLYNGERVTFGVISGTQIGYIYCCAWGQAAAVDFYNALYTLMNDYETSGLIIDYRTNYGGRFVSPLAGFSLLYNTRVPTIDFGSRCSPGDQLSMCSANNPGYRTIPGNPSNYYDMPIAVLTGPGAVSVGDQAPLWMKSHPMVRLFGRPTAGAYTAVTDLDLGNSDWFSRYTRWNTFLAGDSGNYLTHSQLVVDEEVWLTPDDVALGYDTVVEAAKTWINGFAGTLPDITHNPSSIDMSLEYGQMDTVELTVQNNGSRHLFYSLTPQTDNRPRVDINSESSAQKANGLWKPEISYNENISKTGGFVEPYFPPVVTGHGGPDAYGYIWTDSDQPHGPSFEWIDISDVGTEVFLGDDSFAGPISIGFMFPFYENSYSELYICSNGLITFGNGSTDFGNSTIPYSGSPNNFIAPYWDDLNPSAGGDIYYFYDTREQRLIVSYEGVPLYSSQGSSLSFQAVLHPDGKIYINYNEIQWNSYSAAIRAGATIGIENYQGSDGLEIVYNAAYLHDSLSIRIMTDWIGIDPYSGYLAPGEDILATITFNAKNSTPGAYTGNIYLDSNDPIDSVIVIPVTLTITGGCDYVTGDVNGSDSYNSLDITYGVNFFKGIGADPACPFGTCLIPPCDVFFYCGDVNASCSYNGLDITYGVNYFKGGAGPVPCGHCPPVDGITGRPGEVRNIESPNRPAGTPKQAGKKKLR